jgi:hypothetical protein
LTITVTLLSGAMRRKALGWDTGLASAARANLLASATKKPSTRPPLATAPAFRKLRREKGDLAAEAATAG